MNWHWRLLDGAGQSIVADDAMSPGQHFPSQSDAETWLGENWRDLAAAGVAAVTLCDGDREVYGPMSLAAG